MQWIGLLLLAAIKSRSASLVAGLVLGLVDAVGLEVGGLEVDVGLL